MITGANYNVFVTNANTIIGHVYSQMDADETSKQWSSEESMSGSLWLTAWTGLMPKMRPWFGSRVVHEAAIQTYQVEPIPYEITYAQDRFVLDDSPTNGESAFWRLLPDMARQVRRQREHELRDLLEASGVQGTTTRQAGTDGLSAFNTAHPIDIYNPSFNLAGSGLFASGVYCNDFTSGGQTIDSTLIGGALSQTALATLVAYMKMIPGEDGEVLGVMPSVLMVPSTLELTADFLLGAMFLGSPTWGAFSQLTNFVGTSDNMLRKMGIRRVTNAFLRNEKRWYLMDAERAVKPLLWIVREAPRVVPRVNENDPIVFDAHKFTWGGWDRVAPAWNYPWMFARSGP
jgi:phage major head subunit gpT-like protein